MHHHLGIRKRLPQRGLIADVGLGNGRRSARSARGFAGGTDDRLNTRAQAGQSLTDHGPQEAARASDPDAKVRKLRAHRATARRLRCASIMLSKQASMARAVISGVKRSRYRR